MTKELSVPSSEIAKIRGLTDSELCSGLRAYERSRRRAAVAVLGTFAVLATGIIAAIVTDNQTVETATTFTNIASSLVEAGALIWFGADHISVQQHRQVATERGQSQNSHPDITAKITPPHPK